MKTKYLLLIAGILCCISMKVNATDIPIYPDSDIGDWNKDERTITLIPTASIDGNIIRIYTNVTVSELQVSIKDASGSIVYSNSSMESSRCHTFGVYDLPEEEYVLEFEIGEESFYGYFSIL